LVSTATVVVQALALAHLIAGAMPGAHPGNREAAFFWLAGAIVLRGLCALVGEPLAHLGAARTKADLRRKLVGAALREASRPGESASGDVATLAGRGLDALDVYVGRCLPDLVLAVAAPLALAAVIGALDWLSGIIIVILIALFPIFGALVGRASVSLAGDRWRQVEKLGGHIADVFEGLPTLRALGRTSTQRARIKETGETLRKATLSTLRVAFLSALVLDTLASVSVALVAVPLGLRLLNGSIHLASALAVLIVAPEVFLPLRRVSAEFHESTEGLVAADRVMEIIDAERKMDFSRPGENALAARNAALAPGDPCSRPVRLENVWVDRAGGGAPILEEASLTINPGETVVLLGPNGGGKSTTLALLLGFLSPSRGSVRVGDQDLADLDLGRWREKISYLPAHPTLLQATLAENLRLAYPHATDEQLIDALDALGASGFLSSLPSGLATRLGEGNQATSAGELQRIALARVLLRPASLYLLDEPTVHLDPAAELRAVKGIARAVADRSALIVTHRPALTCLADRVVTLSGSQFRPLSPEAPRAETVPA
jgi:thiol reductant ABC exporter CydD subunit